MTPPPQSTVPSNLGSFAIWVAIVMTIAMVLYPPFTSINGTERAFLLAGPEWARGMGALGAELGLTVRVDWIALAVQLSALWAVALGARWFLGGQRPVH